MKNIYKMGIVLVIFLLIFGCSTPTNTTVLPDEALDIPYLDKPEWVSSDRSSISTGLGITDINGDNLPDVIVANGNDIKRQKLAVYYNKGNGVFGENPDWQSEDKDYHGHLSIGDINDDGYDDVVVSVFLGKSGFSSRGHVKAYFNKGGTLESNPSWRSEEDFYTFSLKLGDVDNDGDLDLAVANGESYTNKSEKNKIYINNSGNLETKASWESEIGDYSLDTSFIDVDNDGDLDLLFVASKGESSLYINNSGIIETIPNWKTEDSSKDSNSIIVADVNNDGFLDIAISDNYQLGGSGKFKLYLNDNGKLNTIPDWTSKERGYGSGIAFLDFDNDGWIDLVTGTWGENKNIGTGRIRIYKNNQSILSNSSNWKSSTKSVVEAITFADLNMDGVVEETNEFTGPKSLFYLKHYPYEYINEIMIDNEKISIEDYCYDKELGWVSIDKEVISEDSKIIISYTYSTKMEMIVSNWDSNRGNYIFYNLSSN